MPDILVAGVDEAGRGPLAGAVVAAAIILPCQAIYPGLTDSKRLSEKRREALYTELTNSALAWAIGRAEVEEIDEINILQASLLAMKRAIDALDPVPTRVIVDGNQCPKVKFPVEAIVKGDLTEPAISAASVLAKVTRDREMLVLDEQYPEYGFAKHKGYPTAMHLERLDTHGVSPCHRRTFAPVRKRLRVPA